MANYSVLKAAVQAVVKTNGNQEITGANMQSTLISIINSLGTGYQFMGVATPSTSPGTPDYNVAFIGGAGTYANFGTSVTVPVGSICVFKYNGSWVKEQIKMFAGIDDVPTVGSDNLVKSGGVYDDTDKLDTLTKKLDIELNGRSEVNITDFSIFEEHEGTIASDGKYRDVPPYSTRNRYILIPVIGGDKIVFTPNNLLGTYIAMLKNSTLINDETPPLADGASVVLVSQTSQINVPDDAKFVYVGTMRSLEDTTPVSFNIQKKEPSFYNKEFIDGMVYVEKTDIVEISSTAGRVSSVQIIGQPVDTIIGTGFGNIVTYEVPAGAITKIEFNSGGSYGFALCDANDIVLEYTNNQVESGTYTFAAQQNNSILYVSDAKITAIYLLYKVTEEVEDINETLQDSLTFEEETSAITSVYAAGRVLSDQVIGQQVQLYTGTGYGNILTCSVPANTSARVYFVNKTGAYGFALCDTDGIVLEYIANNASSTGMSYTFASHDTETVLYASSMKLENATYVSEIVVKEAVKEMYSGTIANYWKDKKIWWCGTSIPAGGYPQIVGELLGAEVTNEAVGSSMCRANVRTGDYDGAVFVNITSTLSSTNEEVENFITNYDTLKSRIIDAPNSLSSTDLARLRAGSFENKLLPYLNGTNEMPDLFVFDHGHNDFKYTLSNNQSDIGLEPTTANIGNELTEDTFMTANDNAKLASFFGSLSDIPSNQKADFIASLNRNCFIGAVNFLVTLILRYNPRARILFISNYEYEYGDHPSYAPLIPAQRNIADSWAFPLCEVFTKLGYSRHIIPNSKAWFNSTYTSVTPATTDITVAKVYCPDGVHPHSDTSGNANRIYAGILAEFIKGIR